MNKNPKDKKPEIHTHTWVNTEDISVKRCKDCKAELMSRKEYFKRVLAWERYYKLVRTTRAYKRFIQQKKAWVRGDFKLVKKLAKEARKSLEEVEVAGIKELKLKIKSRQVDRPNFSYPSEVNTVLVDNNLANDDPLSPSFWV